MTIRPQVMVVVDDLLSTDLKRVESAIGTAGLLLEKTTVHFRDQRAVHLAYESLLPEEYLKLKLTDEEIDALAAALLGLLDALPPIGASAVWALHRSARLWVVPRLTELLSHQLSLELPAAEHLDISRSAIISVQDIVTSTDPKRRLTPEQERIIAEACSALQLAATVLPESRRGAKDAARMALDSISKHFKGKFCG